MTSVLRSAQIRAEMDIAALISWKLLNPQAPAVVVEAINEHLITLRDVTSMTADGLFIHA